jgi:hypothetical protein
MQVLVGQLAATTVLEPSVVFVWHSTQLTDPPEVLVVAWATFRVAE